MATLNGERYIRAQLNSIASQSPMPGELVVTDDGSVDATLGIVNKWARSVPIDVRIYRNSQQLGFSRNFERGLRLALGDYVFLADQDDIWLPCKIGRMMERLLQDDSPAVVICNQAYADEGGAATGETTLGRIGRIRGGQEFVSGCATAFRRELLPIILPVPPNIAYDSWIHRVGRAIGRLALIETPLQYFRRHPAAVGAGGSVTGLTSPVFIDRVRGHLQADTVEVCVARLSVIEELKNRLSSHTARGLFRSEGDRRSSLSNLREEAEFLQERLRICSLGVGPRCIGALQLWRTGGYRFASGWKSLIKDSFLPGGDAVSGGKPLADERVPRSARRRGR